MYLRHAKSMFRLRVPSPGTSGAGRLHNVWFAYG